MAKRNATTELNHDNWEDEDEKEEAGEFKKASEDQMKDRVIKKAKRRNLNEDQKKNIFNSFGGFSSTNNVAASDAFSFLATQPTPSNGSTQADDSKTEKSKEEVKVKDSAPFSSGFVFGNSSSTASSVSTGSAFGFQLSKSAEEAADVKDSGPPPSDDLFAKFLKKSSGKWSCDVCMISNDADKTSCVACETPKPGCKPSEPPKDSAQKVEAPEFKFGFNPSPTQAKTEDSSSASAVSGFKFGSEGSLAAGVFGGFTFGSSSNTESKPIGGFKFGATSEAPSDSEPASLATATTQTKTKTEQFQFTDKVATKPDPELNASDTPTKSKKGEYLSSLKSLNTQVTSWIKTHVDQNPLVDLTPVFKDYEKHIGNLRSKYNITASSTKVKEQAKPLSFGSSPSPFSSTFGSNLTSKPALTGFQFGFGSTFEAKQEDKEDDKIEKDDEDDSPKKPADPVVEEDAIYSKKCKLFYKKGDSYAERGLGNLYLKMTEEKKVQLVIRADTSLGNILLNMLMTATTPLERLGKNNVMLVTVPNPPIDPKADSEPVTFLVRVKTAEDADELKQKLDDLCKN